MRATYDMKLEAIALCQDQPAWMVKERLGLDETVRTIQRWTNQAFGTRPTHRSIGRVNMLRDAVAAELELRGHDRRRCDLCKRGSFHQCLIRKQNSEPGVDSLCFVCWRCTRRGDF
jgi:hypothetical protein